MRWILLIAVLLVPFSEMKAQRLIPGQVGIEIQAGILQAEFPVQDYYINVGLVTYRKNGNYLSTNLQYNVQCPEYKNELISHETYLFEAGYVFFLFGNSTRSLNLNAGIQGVLGFELINKGEKILYDGAVLERTEDFLYGAGTKLSLEKFLSNHIMVLLQAKMNAVWGTTMGTIRPSLGLGIRYNF